MLFLIGLWLFIMVEKNSEWDSGMTSTINLFFSLWLR